jgi:hypothetical protein
VCPEATVENGNEMDAALLAGIRYVLSPASFLVLSTFKPIFLVSGPEMKPRMLWFCQEVALTISSRVAPSFRPGE